MELYDVWKGNVFQNVEWGYYWGKIVWLAWKKIVVWNVR